MIDNHVLADAEWRRSSFSGSGGTGGGNCVEIAALPDNRMAVRDSKSPGEAITFAESELAAWIASVRA